MKKYSKPEIKVKEVVMQHLMNGSDKVVDIVPDIQGQPETSESKMIETIFEWLGE